MSWTSLHKSLCFHYLHPRLTFPKRQAEGSFIFLIQDLKIVLHTTLRHKVSTYQTIPQSIKSKQLAKHPRLMVMTWWFSKESRLDSTSALKCSKCSFVQSWWTNRPDVKLTDERLDQTLRQYFHFVETIQFFLLAPQLWFQIRRERMAISWTLSIQVKVLILSLHWPYRLVN